MTSKFTREELLNIINTDHVQCGEASALARMALAAMESEPAPECQHQWKFGGVNKLQSQKQCIKCGRVELDTQQPVVPEKCPAEIRDLIASHSDALFNDDDAQGIWNACRAAMLAVALQEVKGE